MKIITIRSWAALLTAVCLAVPGFAREAPKPAEVVIKKNQSTHGLPRNIQRLLKRYNIPTANISVYIRDLNADKPMVAHNINKLRNPASTMKLLTTYAALKELKPHYSWKTEAWSRGKLNNGTLKGDLILKGYGDPFLVHEKFWKFVQGIRDRGLKKIDGDIIIDNSYFDLPKMDPGAFDNRPYRTYNAVPSALMYNFQATRLLFRPDRNKKKIDILPYPWIPEYQYINRIKYSSGGCQRKHHYPVVARSGKKMLISGSYSAKCGQQYIQRAISDPTELAYNAFRDFWRESGGEITGKMRIDSVNRKTDKRLHTHYSDSLGNQIRVINKWSNNVMTRQLLLTLGAKKYGAPGTLEKGRKAILEVLKENSIDNKGIIIDNGSGLSRTARINARQHGELLEKAWRDPFMPEFMSSLALSGMDGTLVKRFRKDDLRGRSHMKTGTLKNAKSIAGYMLTRKGRWLAVVIHHNGPRIGAGGRVQDAILRWSFER